MTAKPFILFADLQLDSNKEWLVHRLLGHGEASVWFGKPGDGKSVLVEDLALHIRWLLGTQRDANAR